MGAGSADEGCAEPFRAGPRATGGTGQSPTGAALTARRIPAALLRGGAAKGLFVAGRALPADPRRRDALLLRALGCPDPSGAMLDGLGGAGPSAGRVMLVWPSPLDGVDVDCQVGSVAAGGAAIEWGGDCGGLTAAVGPFAIGEAMLPVVEGETRVRLRRLDTGARVDVLVPVRGGEALEDGAFAEEGVPFAAAELRLEHLGPGRVEGGGPLLPTGAVQDRIRVAGLGTLAATLLDAGDPTVFVRADALGLSGREPPEAIERDRRLLERLEAVRAAGAVAMGVAETPAQASARRPDRPALVCVAKPAGYRALSGVEVAADQVDLLARAFSAGRIVRGCPERGAIALAVAAAVPGTVVHEVARTLPGVPTRIGHVSGTLAVGADVSCGADGRWQADKAVLSRSARRLMSGWIHLPGH